MFYLIAAVGKNNEIGKDNDLIFRLKDDMAFFRKKTLGSKVVMGRKTWDSLPGRLEGRTNIVVSHSGVSGADFVLTDLDSFIRENADTDEEIFVIGGESIYRSFIDFAKKIYLTEIDEAVSSATAFFPKFEKSGYTRKVISRGLENGLHYSIVEYDKI